MVVRLITAYDKLRTAYVSTPKVANSSIKAALMIAEGLSIDQGPHHADIEVDVVDPAQIDTWYRRRKFVFGIVRNPWDRLVSAWADKCGAESDVDLTPYGLPVGTSFERFVEVACSLNDKYTEVHLVSQSSLLLSDGKLLPSYIGRFETLEHDWLVIRASIKAKSKIDVGPLKHLRATPRPPYRDHYTPRLAMMVEQRYQDDVRLFGYKY